MCRGSTVMMREQISQHCSQRRKDILLRRKVHLLWSSKSIWVFWPVSNSDWGGQAPGRNSASHKPGNPVTAAYKLHLWLSHDVQNKCMSWWRSKLDSSVELQTLHFQITHESINDITKVTGIQWEEHTSISCFTLSLKLTAYTHQLQHSVLLPFISSLWQAQINPLSNILFPVPSLLRK